MINQQLLDFVKQQLQQNISKEQIKNSLLANGWESSDVEEGFNAVMPRPLPVPPTPPIPPITPNVQQSSQNIINPVVSQQSFTDSKKPKRGLLFVFLLLLIGVLFGLSWFGFKYFNNSKINNQTETQATPDIETLLAKIQNGEKLESAEINSILQDVNVSPSSRFIALELASKNFNDSRDTLEEVFQRPTDDSVLQGKISLILAGHGENIGDLVVERYPNVSPEAKFYYAQTIAALGRKDAIPMLLSDTQQTQNTALRDKAIESLIKLDPSSAQILNLAMSVIRSARALPAGEQRTADDFSKETIAMHAVTMLAEASDPQATDRMLTIARDESIAIDVRLTALEALGPKISTMSSSEQKALGSQLIIFSNQVSKSSQLSSVDKQRMNTRISMLQRIIATGQ